MSKIILDSEKIKIKMLECKGQVKYWEEAYRETTEEFYKNSYKRKRDIWLAKYEVYRSLLDEEENK